MRPLCNPTATASRLVRSTPCPDTDCMRQRRDTPRSQRTKMGHVGKVESNGCAQLFDTDGFQTDAQLVQLRGVSTNFASLTNNFVEFCTKFVILGEGVLGSSCPGLKWCCGSQVSFSQRQETLCILFARNRPREGKFVETPRKWVPAPTV